MSHCYKKLTVAIILFIKPFSKGIFNVYISETIDKRYFPILFIETPQKLYQLCDFVVVQVINLKSKNKSRPGKPFPNRANKIRF